MDINTPIENLTKPSKPLSAALKKLGILTVRDLLLYFPYRYLDFSQVKKIEDLKTGENVSVGGKIKSITGRFSFRGRLGLAEALISDGTGNIKIVWFNQSYLAKVLKSGDEIFVAGNVESYNGRLQFVNPIYEKASDFPVHTSRLLPVYHLTSGLYPKTLRNLIFKALPMKNELVDKLPVEILKRQGLPGIANSVELAHFPKNMEDTEKAKTRVFFEEIFISQVGMQKYKLELNKRKAYAIKFNQPLIRNFVESLPFRLTDGQKKAAWDILKDLEKASPMNRLLEGDVGSGKTLVAIIAALQAAQAGCQVALLAPTEILAHQHYETIRKFLKTEAFEITTALLTGSSSQIDGANNSKDSVKKYMSKGAAGIYIGTHALLQNKIKFKKLALVIIDEQHRFGVNQRSTLALHGTKVPHLLSLSATPIPRTLQLAFYGELEISQIKTKPADRKPIITRLAPAEKRTDAYEFMRRQIRQGRQAFVITPLIEENDNFGIKAAKSEAELLKKSFPEFQIGLLHGRLKGKEKEQVMNSFLKNEIQILVSTSVVEVGVDVPNASIMIIEGAERFGLAQLHQFRGRVGRAEHQSYCILFASTAATQEDAAEKNNEPPRRLELFCKTQDGFELAELDLKLRGFGEIFGSSQAGWNFKYFDPAYFGLIPAARTEAKNLLEKDPGLNNYPELKKEIQNQTIHLE